MIDAPHHATVSPMIWIQNQLVGAHESESVTLECQSEAYPKSINYWTREKGEILAKGATDLKRCVTSVVYNVSSVPCTGGKYEPKLIETTYRMIMKLHIHNVSASDFGSYRCVAKNSLGETDGNIKLYSEYKL